MTKLLELRRERHGYYQLLQSLLGDETVSKELSEQMAKAGSLPLKELRRLIVQDCARVDGGFISQFISEIPPYSVDQ